MSRLGGNPPVSVYDTQYTIDGTIYGGGTGPTASVLKGATFSRGGTGTYTILPDVNYPFIISKIAALTTTLGNQVVCSAYYAGRTTGYAGHTAGSTCYVTFQVTTGGATAGGPGAAIDLAAAEELNFHLAFSRSVVL